MESNSGVRYPRRVTWAYGDQPDNNSANGMSGLQSNCRECRVSTAETALSRTLRSDLKACTNSGAHGISGGREEPTTEPDIREPTEAQSKSHRASRQNGPIAYSENRCRPSDCRARLVSSFYQIRNQRRPTLLPSRAPQMPSLKRPTTDECGAVDYFCV